MQSDLENVNMLKRIVGECFYTTKLVTFCTIDVIRKKIKTGIQTNLPI